MALTLENIDPIITILENVRKGVLSGSISVKDIDKMSLQITETEELLDAFTTQISEFYNQYHQMQSELDSLMPRELISLEDDLTKNSTNLKDLQLQSETFQGEIDEIDSKIPRLVSEIEQNLQAFSNIRYTVLKS